MRIGGKNSWGIPSSIMLAAGVGVAALAAYLPTLAPTITWRNGGTDSGDLAAAVVTFGIPHPPGYPTYVLLGRAWTALPLGGDPAYRLNILSAASAALAAGLSAMTIALLGRRLGRSGLPLAVGATLGGLALALAPLTWSQATIAEVYAPGLAILSLLSLLLLDWWQRGRPEALLAAGLLGGLGLGVLPQLALVVPGALVLFVARAGWRALAPRRLALLMAAAAAGLSTFGYLPLRAAEQPLVNWGDPSTPTRFWAVVSADQYRYLFSILGPTEWLGRLVESIGRLGQELSLVGLCLVPLGVGALRRTGRAGLGYLLSLVALAVLFRTSYPAEGNVVYLLPALYGLVVLAGAGATELLIRAERSVGSRRAALLGLGLLGLQALRAAASAPVIDASTDRRAELFGRQVLGALPSDALLVSERDETTFSLWYYQALGERPDVVVVDSRLLFRDWYRHNLARRHPDLNPAAVRPGGLTALARPVYVLVGPPGEEVMRPAPAGPRCGAPGSIERHRPVDGSACNP